MKLSNKKEYFARTIISNATRWDTFGMSNMQISYNSEVVFFFC